MRPFSVQPRCQFAPVIEHRWLVFTFLPCHVAVASDDFPIPGSHQPHLTQTQGLERVVFTRPCERSCHCPMAPVAHHFAQATNSSQLDYSAQLAAVTSRTGFRLKFAPYSETRQSTIVASFVYVRFPFSFEQSGPLASGRASPPTDRSARTGATLLHREP
jgi:hypothetical protein